MSRRLVQGNTACVEGALWAGCRFFAGYPITPASEISERLSYELPRVGGKFIQMEDEIASLAAVIGASVGGLKAMTATSGPGFSLMQENLGYAAMAEIPCVIVDVQRGGPSTGLPTSPSQGDVMQARWGTHGDHPIIALCPSSVAEVYDLTVEAFNYSEKYRTPVILLMDEIVAHMREPMDVDGRPQIEVVDRSKTDVPPEWYFPYDETRSVPPLVSFGEGFRYHITGLMHDRAGFPTERQDEIDPWWKRVFAKINDSMDQICLYKKDDGLEDARTAVIAYGCTARSAAHAVKMARARRHKAGLLTLQTIWPFHDALIGELVSSARRVIVPELNLGQLALEVERVLGRSRVRRVNRVDGELITPRQILDAMEGG
ncbi:MAG: 2-oxoacid:acceptor oxidoreductase subunit alpha [Chloroflexi bacterium]|nr:2-oxoacid:acceptor oxidoreductase subunit alpha [Chloroflexota bacterium]